MAQMKRCESKIRILSQNCRGLNASKQEELFSQVKSKNIFAVCVQETWMLGTSTVSQSNCVMITNGMTNKPNKLGRCSGGVAIVLSKDAQMAWKKAGSEILRFGDRILAIRLSVLDEKKRVLILFLAVSYSPIGGADASTRSKYYSDLQDCVHACKKNEFFIMGTDGNASMGVRSTKRDYTLGGFGLPRRNGAGSELHVFCSTNRLCATSTFFRKKSYATWFSPRDHTRFQLDHFLIRREHLKCVIDSGKVKSMLVNSDHYPVCLQIRVAKNLRNPLTAISKTVVNRRLLKKPFIRKNFQNSVLETHARTDDGEGPEPHTFDLLQESVLNAAKEFLMDDKPRQPGWFESHEDSIMQAVNARNFASAVRDNHPMDIRAIESFKACRLKVKQVVAVAKVDWVMHRINSVNNCASDPKACWDAISDLRNGMSNAAPVYSMMFKNSAGKLAANETENQEFTKTHFEKLYNNVSINIDFSAIGELEQRPMRSDLDRFPSDEEIRNAILSAKSNKAAGDNQIPVEYWKALLDNNDTFALIKNCLNDFWFNGVVPIEWLIGRLKLLPKKGDLHDLNNWRGIMLLDSMAKIVASIISVRLLNILKDFGLEEQNGFMPNRGCADGTFSLKLALQKRKEHGLDSWVVFIDLIKAFDSVPRNMLFAVLKKFGIPQLLCELIVRLHSGCTVKIKIGEGDVEVIVTVGVKQGDTLAPVLFIIFMQAALEIVHSKWSAVKPSFRSKEDNITHGRRAETGGKSGLNCSIVEFYRSFYADDGAFICESRSDLESSMCLINQQLNRFGLACHIGYGDKTSKTEAMFIPSDFSHYVDGDTSRLMIGNGFVYFCQKFKYLGSLITSCLTDDCEVEKRIVSASCAFGAIRKSVFDCKLISNCAKKLAYQGLILSVLLFGCESWVLSSHLLHRLQSFHRC
jgi:exonuclease III